MDVEVKRGAECNTDHQLLCAKVRMMGSFPRPRQRAYCLAGYIYCTAQ